MLINTLIKNNHAWAKGRAQADPNFFPELAKGQSPEALWIGCADSRVPPEQLAGANPGDLFVHRNVANLVSSGDVNLMAVVAYAVDHLKVKHLIVCGHEGCGGVAAAHDGGVGGIIDHWIAPIMETLVDNAAELNALPDRASRVERLVELNVEEQVQQLGLSPNVRAAWKRGQELTVHGLVFELSTGKVRDLGISQHATE
jgi:carbonic anhydrase